MRSVLTGVLAAACSTVLSADVTIRQSMTMEGQMAAMTAGKMPEIVTRVKGQKSRTDVEVQGQTVSSITDLDTKQVTILQSATKIATVLSGAPPAATAGSGSAGVDVTVKPTGQRKTIDGFTCDEHSMNMSLDMAMFAGSGQMPPDAAAMMKDVKILATGALWVTTTGAGVEEFMAYQKKAAELKIQSALAGMFPQGGMDKLMTAANAVQGVPCVTELTMSFEGTGPMVDVMKQMGPMKMVQKTTGVSLDPVPEAVFVVPADYKVEKQ
jgi:hypothetical protein